MIYDEGDAASFNLKAVVKETGLKPATVRAWERRYGLPMPERSPGGHRLYSPRDVQTLKWLVARQEEGLIISKAVALWRRLEEEGKDPLVELAYDSIRTALVGSAEGPALEELRRSWVQACKDFEEHRADEILAQAFAVYPAETVSVQIISEGLAMLGEDWQEGRATVQQEHFASEQAMRRLEALIIASPHPTRSGRILVACPPDERHVFAPLLISYLLRRRGWDVVNLGADVPVARMKHALTRSRPRLTILSAQQLHTAANLLPFAPLLQQQGIPLTYGGRIFNLRPGVRDRIPGSFLGEEFGQVPEAVERIIVERSLSSPAPPATDGREAAEHFQAVRHQVEDRVREALDSASMLPTDLAVANGALAGRVAAALTLGDLTLLAGEAAGVHEALVSYGVPPRSISPFLESYYGAMLSELGEQDPRVARQLTQLLEEVA